MGVIEFELERLVHAPIERVFARLADIDGHNDWMPRNGSILRHTQQTSPGEPTLGTTFLDETSLGRTPGEVVEFEPPHRLVYHWWDRSRAGRLKVEGWPSYALEAQGPDSTLVRHHARMQTYGLYGAATPVLRRLAVRERTTTIDALTASFGPTGQAGNGRPAQREPPGAAGTAPYAERRGPGTPGRQAGTTRRR